MMFLIAMFSLLQTAEPFRGDIALPAFYQSSRSDAPARHPAIPAQTIQPVTGPALCYLREQSADLAPVGVFFDQAETEGTHWHPGTFALPPAEVLDGLIGTAYEVEIEIELPWGERYADSFRIERGQARNHARTVDGDGEPRFEPEDLADLDQQLAYYGTDGTRVHEFRHPSFSLLCTQREDAATKGGFPLGPRQWVARGEVSITYEENPEIIEFDSANTVGEGPFKIRIEQIASRSLLVRWTQTHQTSYVAARESWRDPLAMVVIAGDPTYFFDADQSAAMEAAGLIPSDPLWGEIQREADEHAAELRAGVDDVVYYWEASDHLVGPDTIGRQPFDEAVSSNILTAAGYKPFPVQPILRLAAVAWVPDFLPFEIA